MLFNYIIFLSYIIAVIIVKINYLLVKVVAGTVENPSCKEQLMAAAREVVNAVEELVSVCNLTQHENNAHLLQELSDAAYQVTTTLNQLLNRLTSASR